MRIRQALDDDAAKLVELIKQVERESAFMLFEADEREITPEQQLKRIQSMREEGNSAIFVAEEGNQLIGYLFAIGGSARRNKHSVYIVIGILKKHTGKGIGKSLFMELQDWATKHEIHRLELTVMKHNENAISLYKKMGFQIEGTKVHSLKINGKYVDEYYMAKLI